LARHTENKLVEINRNTTKQNKLLKLKELIVSEDEQWNMKVKQQVLKDIERTRRMEGIQKD